METDNKTDQITAALAPCIPMLRSLRALGLDNDKKTLAPLFDIMDNPVAYDLLDFHDAITALKKINTFSQSMKSLRLPSGRKSGKKRKFGELNPKNDLSPLELLTERKEFRDIVGSFLSPQELASLSCVTKCLGDTVDKYIGDITEYSCTSQHSEKKEFVAGELTVYVWTPCKEDIYQAWMLQKTRKLKKLSMVWCRYTILLKYCIRNLTHLEFLDVSYSHNICNSVVTDLVRNCKRLTEIRCVFNTVFDKVSETFLQCDGLVHFKTSSLANYNPQLLPSSLRTLELKYGDSLSHSFNRLPPTLEQIEAWHCCVLILCTKLAKRRLSLKKLILHDNSYHSSDEEFAKFNNCRFEFGEMLKTTNMSIFIGVKKNRDVRMVKALSLYGNVHFFEDGEGFEFVWL